MDFSKTNNIDRKFFQKDTTPIKILLDRIRKSLVEGSQLSIQDINLSEFVNYDKDITYVYITLFQDRMKFIRWGSKRDTFEETLNRDISQIREHKRFGDFDVENSEKCRIMIEYVTEQVPARVEDLTMSRFTPTRLEPGVTGLLLRIEGENTCVYMPTDAWVLSQMTLGRMRDALLRKTSLGKLTKSRSMRVMLLRQMNYELYVIKSRAFITYKDEVLNLYRGNVLNTYSPEAIRDIALNSTNWIMDYMTDDGKFMYYYDCTEDNNIDHEHPDAPPDNLYYNDLRHCGGVVALLRAYELTNDEKYLNAARKGIDFIVKLTREHQVDGETAGFIYYNNKGKLGGTALILIAAMKYRNITNDKTYDEYIKKYARHLISRVYKTGEMLGYFIHPKFQMGQELLEMNDEERRSTFSFYYPGEALYGLGLFANNFHDDEELNRRVREKSKIALDWIVDERPKIYADLFTALPSDGWLMQAIEEWCKDEEFRKDNLINFVYTDANTMIDKMYTRDDSPYIDYEGGFYYEYGDHYYPDGARCEGLVAAYYLAHMLGNKELEQKFLEGCRKAALSQMILYNSDKNNYAHLNQKKSERSIRFKATRQWVRVDSIQHVACFYYRLYNAELGK